MFRRITAAAAIGCALLILGACSTISTLTGSGTTPATPPTAAAVTAAFLSDGSASADAFCKVEPAADTVAALLTADPTLATADAAAHAFCLLVDAKKVAAVRLAMRSGKRKIASGPADFGTVLVNGKAVDLKGYVK